MFPWFISPWEAARLSFEAQRAMMSFPWLCFALGGREQVQPLLAKPVVARHPNAIPARQTSEKRKASLKPRRGKDKTLRRKDRMRKR
jgi:hypothetical protein